MTDTPDQQFARPFADFLQEQTSHGELTDKLHQLIDTVTDTGDEPEPVEYPRHLLTRH